MNSREKTQDTENYASFSPASKRYARTRDFRKLSTYFMLFIILFSLLISFVPQVYSQDFDNTNISDDPDPQNEPMIAINPLHNSYDPFDLHVAVGANDYRYGYSVPGLYTSSDLITWTFHDVPTPDYDAKGDPCLAYDSSGSLYYAYLAYNVDIDGRGRDQTIYISKSTDEGETWVERSPGVFWTRASFAGSYSTQNDKPWMVIDQSNDNIYVSWTQWRSNWANSHIMFARSTDGGETFSSPIQLNPYSTSESRHWSQIAVGPMGGVYVVYRRFGEDKALYVVKSTDDGQSFSAETAIIQAPDFNAADKMYEGDSPWTPTLPQIAVGVEGNVYVTWQMYVGPWDDSRERDIYFSRSTDGGSTWDTPIIVNNNPEDGADQFWPAIAVSSEGRVDIIWYDRRDDPGGTNFNLYYTNSFSEGAYISEYNLKVSTQSSSPYMYVGTRYFIGDYICLANTVDEVPIAVWMDSSTGNQEIFIVAIPPPPSVKSCDQDGKIKEVYLDQHPLSETIFVDGTGYEPLSSYDIYLVNHVDDLNDGDPIPSRVSGTETTITSDVSGRLPNWDPFVYSGPFTVWLQPLISGAYDIIVDVNNNGLYDVAIDAIDDHITVLQPLIEAKDRQWVTPDEIMSIEGSGFPPNKEVTVAIIDWRDISGTTPGHWYEGEYVYAYYVGPMTTEPDGSIPETETWYPPHDLGEYMIMVDVDRSGKLDIGDCLSDPIHVIGRQVLPAGDYWRHGWFQPNDEFIIEGWSFPPDAELPIYVLEGSDVISTTVVTTGSDGYIPPTTLLSPPVKIGVYDVWVDNDQNGVDDPWDGHAHSISVGSFMMTTQPYSVTSATGTGLIAIIPENGVITNIEAIGEDTLPTEGKPEGVSFPHGLISFDIEDIAPGETVEVYLDYPSSQLFGSQYWMYQDGIGWYSIPIDGNDGDSVITITATDGGLGDGDETADGTISDPGGPIPPFNIQITPPSLITTVDTWTEYTVIVSNNVDEELDVQLQGPVLWSAFEPWCNWFDGPARARGP